MRQHSFSTILAIDLQEANKNSLYLCQCSLVQREQSVHCFWLLANKAKLSNVFQCSYLRLIYSLISGATLKTCIQKNERVVLLYILLLYYSMNTDIDSLVL